MLPVLFTGGTVIVPKGPNPDEILRLIQERRVTIGFGNPDLLEALTRSPAWPTADFSSLRSRSSSALRKVGSAGKPPLFVDIRIVRPEAPPVSRTRRDLP